jgi:indole-3-glycerol phosphate synthase
MKGFLQEIVMYKEQEVKLLKELAPLSRIMSDPGIKRVPLSMKSAIVEESGVIAEFKRASPSKGAIGLTANIAEVTKSYELAGASAISVLTDSLFFKARKSDLPDARREVTIPILRKDFIIDAYQIYQAKIMGADCILLIAAILKTDVLKSLLETALDLGLEAVVEIHQRHELDKLSGRESIIGVNNRNLNSFKVDTKESVELASELGEVVKVTESGLSVKTDLKALVNAGYSGFLVGESFMSSSNPGTACKTFVNLVNKAKK